VTAQRIHRGALVVAILTALTNAVLAAVGILAPGTAFVLWLAVELPLFALVVTVTVVRIRALRRSGASWNAVLDELAGPAAGLIRAELRAYRSLWLFARRRRDGLRDGMVAIGYTRGTMGMPIAFLIACVVETVAIHLLVPWPWLRTTLLVVSVYGFVPLLGILASRVVHPHLLDDARFVVRSGHQVVATLPVGTVEKALIHRRFQHTSPIVEDDVLYLPGSDGTNVDVLLREPIEVKLPYLLERRRTTTQVGRVALQVDDPEDLRAAFAALRSETGITSTG